MRDHPRIRGEHQRLKVAHVLARGIIPAYAGSTKPLAASSSILWGSSPHTRGAPSVSAGWEQDHGDHPRIRGEHSAVGDHLAVPVGIIPAYAGSTTQCVLLARDLRGSSPHTRGALATPCTQTTTFRDHPRIRGEHGHGGGPLGAHPGIIPAYEGSTAGAPRGVPGRIGSSPHTRGARRPRPSA